MWDVKVLCFSKFFKIASNTLGLFCSFCIFSSFKVKFFLDIELARVVLMHAR